MSSTWNSSSLLPNSGRLKVIIDSTLATPINQRPLDFGVDLVIHSATKYLSGHNDLMAGAVCGKAPLVEAIGEYQRITGGIVDPNTSYLLIRGLKTLALRVLRQNDTALTVARFLEAHPKIHQVFYPGLESHVDHSVAKEQMRGFGGLISFEVDGTLDQTRNFVHRLVVPYIAPSLGGGRDASLASGDRFLLRFEPQGAARHRHHRPVSALCGGH